MINQKGEGRLYVLTRSIEDIILAEIGKQRTTKVDDKVAHFNQICTRLGIEPQRLNEITPHLREILEEETQYKPYH